MFGSINDRYGTGARTILPIPKKDWCRIAFIVNEYNVNSDKTALPLEIVVTRSALHETNKFD